MKVGDLVKRLSGLDQTMEVILSKDSEGNGFKMLHADGVGVYPYCKDDYGVEVVNEDDYIEGQYGDETLPYAVVLWP